MKYSELRYSRTIHYVKSVQIRSCFWSVFSGFLTEYGDLLRNPIYSVFSPNTGKYGPKINPYLDTSNAAITAMTLKILPFIAKLKILPFLYKNSS